MKYASRMAFILAATAGCGPATYSGSSVIDNDAAVSDGSLPVGALGCGLHTQFPGDEQCLQAPADGIQLHYGPTNYDDPVEVATYMLDAGVEDVRCAVVGSPHAGLLVASYEARERTWMHHVWVDQAPATPETPSAMTVCSSHMPVQNQWMIQQQHVSLNVSGGAPEWDGAAFDAPGGSFILAIHAINTTEKPWLREMWVNLHTVTKTDKILSWLAVGGPYKMNVAPHSSVTVRASAGPIGLARTLVAMFGHVHSHTLEQRAYDSTGKLIYRETNWEESHVEWFTSLGQGPVTFDSTHKMAWECDVQNTTDLALKWGNHVDTAEMCGWAGIVATKSVPQGLYVTKPWLANAP